MMLRFEKYIGATTTVIGSIVLCLMAVQIVVDVIMRNMLGSGFPATTELVSKYFMLVVSFLPVAYAELERRHIEASVFTDLMPEYTRPPINLLGFLLSVIVYAFLTYGTATEAARQTSRKAYVETGLMDFYTWPGYWILPICFGLMTAVLVMRVFQVLVGKFVTEDHLLLETHENSEV